MKQAGEKRWAGCCPSLDTIAAFVHWLVLSSSEVDFVCWNYTKQRLRGEWQGGPRHLVIQPCPRLMLMCHLPDATVLLISSASEAPRLMLLLFIESWLIPSAASGDQVRIKQVLVTSGKAQRVLIYGPDL